MKTPKKLTSQLKNLPNEGFISPSFQDIIKHEQLGKKLQSDAFYSAFKTIKSWFIHLKSPKQTPK